MFVGSKYLFISVHGSDYNVNNIMFKYQIDLTLMHNGIPEK